TEAMNKRPELDKTRMRFSFTYVAVALALLMLLQGIFAGAKPVAVPYSRFLQLLDRGQIEEALIGADRIRFRVRDAAPLDEEESKAIERNQALAARWTGAKPERLFEVTRLPGIDDNTLLAELIRKDVVFAGRIENTFWRD